MNINKKLIKLNNDILSSKNNLNFDNITYILREYFNKLILLRNKRNNNNNDNQYTISQNENNLEYLNNINKNLFLINIINKKNLLYINNIKKQNIGKNKNRKEKIFIIEKIKNKIINENGNLNKYIYLPNFIKKDRHYIALKNTSKGDLLKKIIKENNKNLNEEELLNNEIKVKKYNKNVYINKFLFNKSDSYIKKKRNSNIKRSSKFRGVSKNGAGWQVLLMYNNNKPYIGTYSSEELAARIYDIASIKSFGIKSKTNFLYKSEQIEKILKTNIDFKNENISNVISELI